MMKSTSSCKGSYHYIIIISYNYSSQSRVVLIYSNMISIESLHYLLYLLVHYHTLSIHNLIHSITHLFYIDPLLLFTHLFSYVHIVFLRKSSLHVLMFPLPQICIIPNMLHHCHNLMESAT